MNKIMLFLMILVIVGTSACGATKSTSPSTPTPTSIPSSTPTANAPKPTLTPAQPTQIPDELLKGVKIQFGSYDGIKYTSPEGNFSCVFGDADYGLGAFDPTLTDEGGSNWVQVYKTDIWGEDYGVFYTESSSLSGDASSLLLDSKTMQDGLEIMFANVLALKKETYAGAEELHQELINEEILFGLINVLDNKSANETISRKQAFYMFTKGSNFYLLNYYTMVGKDENTSEMQVKLEKFYSGCEFGE